MKALISLAVIFVIVAVALLLLTAAGVWLLKTVDRIADRRKGQDDSDENGDGT